MGKTISLKPKKSVAEIIFIVLSATFFAIFIISYAYSGFWILTSAFKTPQKFLEKPFSLPKSIYFENIVTAFTIKQKGVVSPNSKSKGNLYVKVVVETPKNLTSEQKKLLQQFAESCGEKNFTKKTGFFKKFKK